MQLVDPPRLLENMLQIKDLSKVRNTKAASHITACALAGCLVFLTVSLTLKSEMPVNSPSLHDNRHGHVVIKLCYSIQPKVSTGYIVIVAVAMAAVMKIHSTVKQMIDQ